MESEGSGDEEFENLNKKTENTSSDEEVEFLYQRARDSSESSGEESVLENPSRNTRNECEFQTSEDLLIVSTSEDLHELQQRVSRNECESLTSEVKFIVSTSEDLHELQQHPNEHDTSYFLVNRSLETNISLSRNSVSPSFEKPSKSSSREIPSARSGTIPSTFNVSGTREHPNPAVASYNHQRSHGQNISQYVSQTHVGNNDHSSASRHGASCSASKKEPSTELAANPSAELVGESCSVSRKDPSAELGQNISQYVSKSHVCNNDPNYVSRHDPSAELVGASFSASKKDHSAELAAKSSNASRKDPSAELVGASSNASRKDPSAEIVRETCNASKKDLSDVLVGVSNNFRRIRDSSSDSYFTSYLYGGKCLSQKPFVHHLLTRVENQASDNMQRDKVNACKSSPVAPSKSGEKSFICDKCKRSFPNKHGIEQHACTHTGD